MTLLEYILEKYPTLSADNLGLKDDGEGVVISFWDSEEVKPSDEDARRWESEVLQIQRNNPPKTEIATLEAKQLLMQQALDDLILGGMF